MLAASLPRSRAQIQTSYICSACLYRYFDSADSSLIQTRACITTNSRRCLSSTSTKRKANSKGWRRRPRDAVTHDGVQEATTPHASTKDGAQDGSEATKKEPRTSWGASIRRLASNIFGVKDARNESEGVSDTSKLSSPGQQSSRDLDSRPESTKPTIRLVSARLTDQNIRRPFLGTPTTLQSTEHWTYNDDPLRSERALKTPNVKDPVTQARPSDQAARQIITVRRIRLQQMLTWELNNLRMSSNARSRRMADLWNSLLSSGISDNMVQQRIEAATSGAKKGEEAGDLVLGSDNGEESVLAKEHLSRRLFEDKTKSQARRDHVRRMRLFVKRPKSNKGIKVLSIRKVVKGTFPSGNKTIHVREDLTGNGVEGNKLSRANTDAATELEHLMAEFKDTEAAKGNDKSTKTAIQAQDVQAQEIAARGTKGVSNTEQEVKASTQAKSKKVGKPIKKPASSKSQQGEDGTASTSTDVTESVYSSQTGKTLQAMAAFKNMKDAVLNKDRIVSLPASSKKAAKATKANSADNPPSIERKGMQAYDVQSVDAHSLHLTPVHKDQKPVPHLEYGLERVLFNPGVYHLQDPRSRVFNFDPYLQSIMPVNEFDYNALKQYMTSSRDNKLLGVTKEQKRKYTGSTSSMTSALAHFHYLLSQWRDINPGKLSRDFPVKLLTFTNLQRAPAAVFLKWRDGVYAIDADKKFDVANILSLLGKSMEKLLTLPKEELEKYRRGKSHQISEEERSELETYHYTTMGDFLMRSQLDAHDPRIPGTGMFDLKTRAVVSIRMDVSQWEDGVGYEIQGRFGDFESYEREYFDMIRAAFLKYSLQVRMGRMDGIFVAFHNIERIFGFQYIPLPEMDYALHGSEDTTIGDSEFKLSLDLLNRALDRATATFPEKTLRIHFETRPTKIPFMYIFVEPMEEEQVERIQETNKDKIMEFEREVMGLETKVDEQMTPEEAKAYKDAEWAKVRAKVEESVEKDELGISEARAVVQSLIEDNEILGLSEEEVAAEVEALLADYYKGVEDDDRSDVQSATHVIDDDQVDYPGRTEAMRLELDESPEKGRVIENETDDMMQNDAEEDAATISEETEVDGEAAAPTPSDAQSAALSSADSKQSSEAETEETESLETSTDSEAASIDETSSTHDASPDSAPPIPPQPLPPLLAMVLTVRNKVNGRYVERPENLTRKDKWTVEYALAEFPSLERAHNLYDACKIRREKAMTWTRAESTEDGQDGQDGQGGKAKNINYGYMENLKRLAIQGRKWRKKIDEKDRKAGPVKVLGVKEVVVERVVEKNETRRGRDKGEGGGRERARDR